MQKSGLVTNIGILAGVVAIMAAIIMGGNPTQFIDIPSVLITIIGSFSALLINYSWDDVVTSFHEMRRLFREKSPDPAATIEQFTALATRARREGLLVLEDETPKLDPFLGKGLQMVIDGMDSSVVTSVLEIEMSQMEARHATAAGMLGTWANLAPGFGMIGTLIGLIQMLGALDDPDAIGPAMAVALITTMYGAIMANFVFTPLSGKVTVKSKQVMLYREMILEGLASLQAGVNPRVIEQRLRSFVAPASKSGKIRAQKEAADD
ncbi:MAG: motility protein A [Peptococcaceae bacterium]|nr:motility protein A [Peptococcaceae bacterium]